MARKVRGLLAALISLMVLVGHAQAQEAASHLQDQAAAAHRPGRSGRLRASATSAGFGTGHYRTHAAHDLLPARPGHELKAETGAETGPTDPAQVTTGNLAGAITRADDGSGVAGATITVLQAGVVRTTASSGADGTYSITEFPPGTYDIKVTASGYESQTQTGVTVTSQATTTVNFSLSTVTVTYIYDASGRLLAVVDQDGESARYNYDAVGNLESITRQSSATVSLIDFTPKSGLAGTIVTIYGTGFSLTPSQNSVNFNGVAAAVTSSTATRIVTAVPAGATTGPINVTAPGGSASSSTPFTVASTAPVVNGFTPTIGVAGTAVNITGSNFDNTASGNRVAFNGKRATPNTATTTSITTSVPVGATSGRISVSTVTGKGTSTDYFFVPPSPFTAADVEVTGQMAVGESKTVTIAAANKIGLIVFEGAAGQRISLRMTAVTMASTVAIHNPDGTSLGSTTASTTSGGFIDTRTLPADGTYTILVDPQNANVGSLTLSLYDTADATGTITAGGPPVTAATTVPGQNARLTFSGTAGQRISLKVDATAYGANNSQVSILNPDGTTLASDTNVNTGDFIDTRTLAATGTYTVLVDPDTTNIGSMTLSLYDVPPDASGTITAGGPSATVTTTVPGQNARLTFDGTAGQRISLRIDNSTYGSSNSQVIIHNPDGTTLASDTSANTGDFIDTKVLPATGTYTILVEPDLYFTGSMTLTLNDVSTDVTGTITPGGPPVTVTTTVPGQNARLTFGGTAGQRISLRIDNSTYGSSNSQVIIYNPDGTVLASDTSANTGDFIDTRTLAATGTYTILIDPDLHFTGSMTLTLYDVPPDASGTITPGGPAVTLTTTVPGQNGQLTFSGTTGQRISLKVDNSTYGASNSQVIIRNPDGTTLASDTSASTGDFIDTKVLPADGTYTIAVDPDLHFIGSMTLSLYDVSTDVTGTITPGGPAVTVSITAPGQNARLTFGGTTGQRISLRLTAVTIASSGVSIIKPDGTNLVAPTTINTSGGFIDTKVLPADGAYTILIDPATSNTGSMTLTLYDVPADASGTITPGGPAVTLTTTVPGQNGQLTFSGTAGQRVSLRMTGVTIAGSTSIVIRKPDGTNLATGSTTTSGSFIDTQTLPATGTYTISIDPASFNTGNITLTLNDANDISGTITPGGPAVIVSITTAGQNARLTFGGTTGQRISLRLTAVTIANSGVSIIKPDGTNLVAPTTILTTGGFIDTKVLPADGSLHDPHRPDFDQHREHDVDALRRAARRLRHDHARRRGCHLDGDDAGTECAAFVRRHRQPTGQPEDDRRHHPRHHSGDYQEAGRHDSGRRQHHDDRRIHRHARVARHGHLHHLHRPGQLQHRQHHAHAERRDGYQRHDHARRVARDHIDHDGGAERAAHLRRDDRPAHQPPADRRHHRQQRRLDHQARRHQPRRPDDNPNHRRVHRHEGAPGGRRLHDPHRPGDEQHRQHDADALRRSRRRVGHDFGRCSGGGGGARDAGAERATHLQRHRRSTGDSPHHRQHDEHDRRQTSQAGRNANHLVQFQWRQLQPVRADVGDDGHLHDHHRPERRQQRKHQRRGDESVTSGEGIGVRRQSVSPGLKKREVMRSRLGGVKYAAVCLWLSAALVGVAFAYGQKPACGACPARPGLRLQVPQGIPESLWRKHIPADNPLTKDKVALGEALYFDKRLSLDGTVSCATCHDPATAFADLRTLAVGLGGKTGARNTPTVLNAMFSGSQFWDGRAASLEEQVKQPLVNPAEMGMPSLGAVVARVAAARKYRQQFARVFGDEGVTIDTIAKAIAAYERTQLSGNSPFDRFIAGDTGALTDAQKRGWALFRGKAQCIACHTFTPDSPFFTDFDFHNTGIAYISGDLAPLARRAGDIVARGTDDEAARVRLSHAGGFSELGRFLVTKQARDIGAFKTPSLRDVELTAPYMHNAAEKTLLDVVRFYNGGGRTNAHLDERMFPLKLTDEEMNDIVQLLRALTSDDVLRRAQTARPQTRRSVRLNGN